MTPESGSRIPAAIAQSGDSLLISHYLTDIPEVSILINLTMPKLYASISEDLHDWALRQSVFFVASASLRGKHVNLSPKDLPDASFAILGPNEAAYIDVMGSGKETICHLRENGRITVMFCSFDVSPRILRLFCNGSVIEWNQPEFPKYLERMGKKGVLGARAIIHLDVYKV